MNVKSLKEVLQSKLVISFIYIFLSIITIVPITDWYINILENCFSKDYQIIEISNIFDCFKAIFTDKTILLIYLIITVQIALFIFNIFFTKKQMKTEKEGIRFTKDGTHGTASLITPQEIDILKIGDEANTSGIVLGKTLDTDEIITLPDSCKKINRNIMIWGSSGSGKSTSYIIPNALKIADQEKIFEEKSQITKETLEKFAVEGKNVVCTDPKGELYGLTSKFFQEKGYDVRVFNLVNPNHSDGIDLFKFIEKEIDAQVFSQVVISTNQNVGKKGDEFWQNNQENLLKALLLHIKFEVEDKNKKNMRYLNSILASGDIKKVDEVFKHSKGITKIAYNIYAQASDVIKQSTITGLATKLQIFQLDEIAAITEKNDIDFTDLNDKKMIIYCIISDMDTTMSFLNNLFFSFLFIKTIRQADRNINKKLDRQLCILLDEFANIGQIPDFQQKLSTTRSRNISCTIVCQHIASLIPLYPDDAWQGLIGNCDIKIVMGVNDLMTANYVTKSLGVSSAISSSVRKDAEFDGALEYGVESTSVVKRNVMNEDEIMRMDNTEEIIIIRGYKPFKCKKLRYWEYRLGQNIEERSVENYEPINKYELKPLEENENEDEVRLPTFEEFLKGRRTRV